MEWVQKTFLERKKGKKEQIEREEKVMTLFTSQGNWKGQ